MNKPNATNVIILRAAAQNAVNAGHFKEARGIYQRILKLIENAHGKESTEYLECLTEAGLMLQQTFLKEAAAG